MDVRFHRLAAEEYRAARAWYERRRLGFGDDFKLEVDRAVGRILESPDRWPIFRERFRRVRLRRFPYELFYHQPAPEDVLVLAVAHAKRRPGYWTRRGNR